MEPYLDPKGSSGIAGYAIGPDHLDVEYKNGGVYRYSAAVFGAAAVEQMKQLARVGDGLNTLINRHPKKNSALRLY